MSAKSISRRDFIKLGCGSVAAAGLTVCGFSQAIPITDPSTIDLPSSSFGEKTMNAKILVTYASGLGSTAEVAIAIGQTLSENGWAVDVKPIQENLRIDGYQAIIIGSAVRHGNWLPEAVEYVKAHQQALNQVPIALFTVHITNLGNDLTSQQNRMSFLNLVRPVLNPFNEVFFAGKFDRHGAALLLPGWLARLVPTLDFRKWEKIRSWANSVHTQLHQQI